MEKIEQLKGLLIDLDGVLYIEGEVIPGAVDAVNWLREKGLPFRFVTNTTMSSQAALSKKLSDFGFTAKESEIFSTCVVAAKWLKQKGYQRLQLLLPEEPRRDFSGFELADENVNAVVVGDLGEAFNYEIMNRAFGNLKAGADLIALQKNRYWQRLDGLALDVGAWVALLEYASEKEAAVIGKPNRAYFEMALKDMGLIANEVAMIGDDLSTDIKGGAAAGLKTIFVKTGKSEVADLESTTAKPDFVFDSIAELPGKLGMC